MKKITTLFAFICALFATATAQVNQTVVFDFSNNAWGIPTYEETNFSGVKSATVFTDYVNTITIDPTANKGSFYYDTTGFLRLQKSGSKIILPAFNFAVEKIEVAGHASATSYPNVDMNIYVSNTAVSTACVGSTETYTYEIAADNQAAGNVYELVIGNGGGAYSSIMYITAIKVYPKVAEGALTITAPVLENGAGVYTSPVTVKVSSPTAEVEGVTEVAYYYTTDGYEPDSECEVVENGEIIISETCTLKVAIGFTYEDETYISESTTAEYIISEEVTAPKATTIDAGKFFIVANNKKALPFKDGKLPVAETAVEGETLTDAAYYAFTIENASDGKYYIKDANGRYIIAYSSTKLELSSSSTYHQTEWSIAIENGVAKITRTGFDETTFVIVYQNNAFTVIKSEDANATTIYPALYEAPTPFEITEYTPSGNSYSIASITVTFSQNVTANRAELGEQFPIYKEGAGVFPIDMASWSTYRNVLTITPTATINEPGRYYIKIPAAYFVREKDDAKMKSDAVIYFNIVEEVDTAIENVESENVNINIIYDITGRRVNEITKAGIYIVNGKKVFVK